MRKAAFAVMALGASLTVLVPAAVEAQGRRGGSARDTATKASPCADRTGRERAVCDSTFAAMQARGHAAMGVDQYTSSHVFDDLEDGGRIELQRDEDDAAGVATIRMHLQHIAQAFAGGDFALPGFVHAQEVPGTKVMAERRALIRYEYRPLPRGGEVRITTRDAAALAAIHAFLAFQRKDHHAGGRSR